MGKSIKKSAGILFTDGKSILLLLRSPESKNGNTWGLPGGKSKQNETELENAKRESREELGIESIPGDIFDSMQSRNDNKIYTAFFCKVNSHFKINLNNEHTEYKWVPFEDLNSLNLHPKMQSNLKDYLRVLRKKCDKFHDWTILKDAEMLFT